jgi:hypothetical protein
VVDIGAALVARHHAQTVADAAALAGARQLGGAYERADEYDPDARALRRETERGVLRAAAQVAERNRINLATLTLAELRIGSWNPASQSFASYQCRRGCLAGPCRRSDTDVPGRSPGDSPVGHRRVGYRCPHAARRSSFLGGLPAPVGIASGFRRPRPDRRQARGVLPSRQRRSRVPAGRRSLRRRPPSQVFRHCCPD